MTWYPRGKWGSESLLDCYSSSTHILTITGHILQLHPNHIVPLPPCSLHICLMSFFPCFGKVVLSLIPGLWLPLSVMVPTLCLLCSHRSAQESSPSQGSLSRLLSKSSACHVSSMIARLSFCSQHLTVLLGCGWKYPESKDCPFLCVSVFAVPIPDKVCCTDEAGYEGVLSSHCLCPSASIMPFFVYFFGLLSTFSVLRPSLGTLQGQKLYCIYLSITNTCIYFYPKCE